MKGTPIAVYLVALSRELRTLERLLYEVARAESFRGFGAARLLHAVALNLAPLACRADELSLLTEHLLTGELDPLPGPGAQPRRPTNLN